MDKEKNKRKPLSVYPSEEIKKQYHRWFWRKKKNNVGTQIIDNVLLAGMKACDKEGFK